MAENNPNLPKNWVVVTAGTFIKAIVDSSDHAIAFRLLEISAADDQDRYTQKMEVVMIPNGRVREELQRFATEDGEATVDDDLIAFLEKGILK